MTSLQFTQPFKAKREYEYLYFRKGSDEETLKITHRTSLMEALKEVLGFMN